MAWDRNQIHSKSKVVKAWLAKHPGVVAEDFPGYVPDLNPDEGVWGWTKYGRLANLAANDKDELWDHVVEELLDLVFDWLAAGSRFAIETSLYDRKTG